MKKISCKIGNELKDFVSAISDFSKAYKTFASTNLREQLVYITKK